MRVFVTGASGVLGRRLVRRLAGRGDRVVGAVRSERSAAAVREAGGVPVTVDLFDADALARAAEGAEVVIHAATAIPTGSGANARGMWALNDRIRREGTRALTRAAARVGAKRYLQQSIVWVVRPEHGEPYDERTPPNPSPVGRSAVDGEEIALEAGAKHGFATGVLRCGSFYAHDAGHTIGMAESLRRRRLPVPGRGDALFAPLHADDAASAFVAATAPNGHGGIWHVVDDAPLPFADFLRTFARAIGAPRPIRVPLWLARLVAGRPAIDMVTRGMNTTNARIRAELGWGPRYRTFAAGIEEVARRWRGEA